MRSPILIALLASAAAAPAYAAPIDTAQCAVTPLTATDIPSLQKAADCFGSAVTDDLAQAATLNAAAKDATAAQTARLDRIAALKAAPPIFSAEDVTVNEDAGTVSVRLVRTGNNGLDSQVWWRISGGTAVRDVDYKANNGGFNWPATWNGSMVMTVPLLKDAVADGDKTITIALQAGPNAALGHQPTITIKDVPPPPPVVVTPPPVVVPPPVVDPTVEVRQPDGSILAPAKGVGLPDIKSEFDTKAPLIKTWGSGAIPPSMGGDPLGAFRFVCGAGPAKYDDPILFPGQPGRSHLHQFYGNTKADGNSTYKSLRTSGDSTCGSDRLDGLGHGLNRSAYWLPAFVDGKGHLLQPDAITVYYKRIPDSDPNCHPESNPKAYGICIGLPNGLRFIGGSDMKGGYRQAHAPKQIPYVGAYRFNCTTAQGLGIAGVSGQYFDLASMPVCPAGGQIMAVIQMPNCWDGVHLDSADHGSHMDYMYQGKCPVTHPYLMPFFLIEAGYKVTADIDQSTLHLSSDEMDPTKPRGWSLHADWFGAWDPDTHATWITSCINGHLSCTGGDLGNGTQMQASVPLHLQPNGTLVKSYTNPHPVVPLPVNPMQGMSH